MTETHKPTRPQFSLWFLLFVIPTIAGIAFGAYSAFAAQDKRFRDLMAEKAMLLRESSEAEVRKNKLTRAEHSLEKILAEWNSPEAVLFEIKTRPPAGYSQERDPVYFFLQASDQQLQDLVDLLAERFPDSHREIQIHILECLRSFSGYVVSDRLDGLRGKVREFVEPLQFDSDDRIRQLAIETLYLFNPPSPLREED